ncbi:ParM/StbA family protein [Pseudomonas sp. EMN2]|uniref:ParM/StbA family protein n=1 Tax=Pseudomonas sp. EMN2 TaxID=2615212 RepID=UPI00129A22AA|nr:ParM/StbA family protein [Pseudomonas sp. EMN2]
MKKTQSSVRPRLVADDNGFADHKIVQVGQDGKFLQSKFPTLIQIGGSSLTSIDGAKEDTYNAERPAATEGGQAGSVQYCCSVAVTEPMHIRNQDYPVSEANRVLMHHALHRSGLAGEKVRVGVTLPFSDFFKADGTPNKELQQRCIDNFMQNNVKADGAASNPEVVEVRVYPEALSAFYDWGLDESGNITKGYEYLEETDGSMLIVDIGGSTTDIVSLRMVEGNLKIAHDKSGSVKLGVLDAGEAINLEYQKAFGSGHNSALSPRMVKKILETKQLVTPGGKVDWTSKVDAVMWALAQRITGFITQKVGNISEYQVIHIVGGGAVLFREWLKDVLAGSSFGNEYSIANGVLKYMIAQEEDGE